MVWVSQFGSLRNSIGSTNLAVDAGGLYLGGTTHGAVVPTESSFGSGDGFVIKVDLSGTMQWAKQIGTSADDAVLGVAVTSNGVFGVGRTNGEFPGNTSSGSDFDGFLARLDLAGSLQSVEQFGGFRGSTEWATSVDVDGSVYVAGITDAAFPGETYLGGGADILVGKYDADGNLQWLVPFGSAGYDNVEGLAVYGGDVYITGSS
jgi:hypothetical protein